MDKCIYKRNGVVIITRRQDKENMQGNMQSIYQGMKKRAAKYISHAVFVRNKGETKRGQNKGRKTNVSSGRNFRTGGTKKLLPPFAAHGLEPANNVAADFAGFSLS